MAKKILVVLTSTDTIPSSGRSTGWFSMEFAHPYHVFTKHNFSITTASPKGGVAPLDPSSTVSPFAHDPITSGFLATKQALWEQTVPLSSLDPAKTAQEYDAIFYPGGQGPMFDLTTNEASIALIRQFVARGKPVAAVCHAPAALLNVKFADGTHLLHGRTVTALTNDEETAYGHAADMPFELETELTKVAGSFVKAQELWGVKVVVDGPVITGQNPASSTAIAEALVIALGVQETVQFG